MVPAARKQTYRPSRAEQRTVERIGVYCRVLSNSQVHQELSVERTGTGDYQSEGRLAQGAFIEGALGGARHHQPDDQTERNSSTESRQEPV
jgi:hypothetical protein